MPSLQVDISILVDKILPAFVTFYFVALGHSIVEKSGILNLAIDGIFFMATGAAVYGAFAYGDPIYGCLLGALVAAILGIFMSSVLTFLPISHGAVGLSLQFLSYGIGIVLGYFVRLKEGAIYGISFMREDVYKLLLVAILLGIVIHFIIEKVKLGVAIRAVGENPHAASALGVRVLVIRAIAGAIGFAFIGLGGSVFILSYIRTWDAKLYALGYGWLAFAVALAAGRHPILLIPVALLFGGLVSTQTDIQSLLGVPADVAKLVPFVAALILMITYGATKLRRIFASPSSLGKPYYKEEKSL